MPPQDTQTQQLEPRNGVLVVDGYGISLRTHNGHLTVEAGVGRNRATSRFPRVHHGLSRIVLLGTTGYVTLEAIRWLDDLNIPLIHLAADGTRPLATTTRTVVDNAKLRRAQALTHVNGTAVGIARQLLSEKIAGQNTVAMRLGADGTLDRYQAELDAANSTEQLMVVEAEAARLYWELWTGVPVRFADNASRPVPEHWTVVGPRSSPLTTQRARHAATPTHALLNYAYALIEAEATVACHAMGLDPGLGVLHADKNGRQSLVHDLMEPIRPLADAHVLTLLRGEPFARRDFLETRGGACRLNRRLTRELATTTATWAKQLGPLTERVARQIADGHHRHLGAVTSSVAGTRREVNRGHADARDTAYYRDVVYPAVRTVPATTIAEATGLSIHYAAKIRSGKHMPHRRHWEAIRQAAKSA